MEFYSLLPKKQRVISTLDGSSPFPRVSPVGLTLLLVRVSLLSIELRLKVTTGIADNSNLQFSK